MAGPTYPALTPHELRAETMSKTRTVTSQEMMSTCMMIIVAMKTAITERMMTSMLFESSASAMSMGTFFPWYRNGTRTVPLTKARLNHQIIPLYPRAIRVRCRPPAVLPLEPPMNMNIVSKTRVTVG